MGPSTTVGNSLNPMDSSRRTVSIQEAENGFTIYLQVGYGSNRTLIAKDADEVVEAITPFLK